MILNDLISVNDIEKRKQLIRDIMDYKLDDHDHIPILITHYPDLKGYPLSEVYKNKKIQLSYELDKIRSSLEKVPNGDYIPSIKSDLGFIVTQSIFGMKTIYPETPPYVDPATKPIKSIKDMYDFKRPDDILSMGLIPEGLERIKYFMNETNYEIPTSSLDCGTGLLDAYELTDTNLFFTTMKDDPKAIQHVADILTDIIIDIEDAVIDAAGGMANITSTDWDDKWYPEGKKGYITPELQSLYHPDDYAVFDLPYCNRQFKKFGPGFIHNCGPQTAMKHFWKHEPKPYGLTCDYNSSLNDFKILREIFSQDHKAVLLVELTNMINSDEMVNAFTNLMNTLAPDVIAIPWMWIGSFYPCQEDPGEIYNKLLKVSKEYMSRMKQSN